MHLYCAYVLPWSVCPRCVQHWAPAASQTGVGHKGHNPYTPPHQNRLREVQPSHAYNNGPILPMAAVSTIVEYQYIRNQKGKKLVRYEQNKKNRDQASQVS